MLRGFALNRFTLLLSLEVDRWIDLGKLETREPPELLHPTRLAEAINELLR
jgi:hypothetical protein